MVRNKRVVRFLNLTAAHINHKFCLTTKEITKKMIKSKVVPLNITDYQEIYWIWLEISLKLINMWSIRLSWLEKMFWINTRVDSLIRDTRVYGNLCHPICSPFGYREEQEIVCDVRHDIFDNFVLEGHISLFYLIYFIPMFIAKLYYVTFRGCPLIRYSYNNFIL